MSELNNEKEILDYENIFELKIDLLRRYNEEMKGTLNIDRLKAWCKKLYNNYVFSINGKKVNDEMVEGIVNDLFTRNASPIKTIILPFKKRPSDGLEK